MQYWRAIWPRGKNTHHVSDPFATHASTKQTSCRV